MGIWKQKNEATEYSVKIGRLNRYVISENIRKRLSERGMMQKEFAQKVGVNEVTMSRWMSGIRPPSLYAMFEMAKVLNCTIDDLVKGLDE